jgi:hypothetical protein
MLTHRQLIFKILLTSYLMSSAAQAHAQTDSTSGDEIMNFDCIATYNNAPMEHIISIDLTQNTVTADHMLFVDGKPSSSNTFTFVQSNESGARWGYRQTQLDPTDPNMAEFRLDVNAMTYGFLSFGQLVTSGTCHRPEQTQ